MSTSLPRRPWVPLFPSAGDAADSAVPASAPVQHEGSVVALVPIPVVSRPGPGTAEINTKLALLSLLRSTMAEQCMAWLRGNGATGPSQSDYDALQREGLAVRGSSTGNLIPTPRGRMRAQIVAQEIARQSGAHVATFGLRNRMAYFHCTCGANVEVPIAQRGAQSLVRSDHDRHMRAIAGAIENAPVALGNMADCEALISDRIAKFKKFHGIGERRDG